MLPQAHGKRPQVLRRYPRLLNAIAVIGGVSAVSLGAPSCRRAAESPPGERDRPARPAARPPAASSKGDAVAPAPTPAVTIDVGSQRALFHVQIASTPEERANGLIGRPTLASDAGLLVIFDRPAVQSIATKTTLIPIDLIFIGPDRRVVGVVAGAKPRSAARYRVAAPSQYVLEIVGGLASRLGIRAGQTVDFRAIPGT